MRSANLVVLGLGLAMAVAPGVDAGKLYKWVDRDGRVTYQDRPPPAESGRIEEKDIDPNKNVIQGDPFTAPRDVAPGTAKDGRTGAPERTKPASGELPAPRAPTMEEKAAIQASDTPATTPSTPAQPGSGGTPASATPAPSATPTAPAAPVAPAAGF